MALLYVVDDEADLRELVREILAAHGHRVTALPDAAAFRTRAAEARPDLAVLDVNMPGEDGIALARWAREHLGCGVIMLTAAGTVLDRVIGLEIGADDYVVKPFEPAELVARVAAVLRRRAPRPALPPGTIRLGRLWYEPASGRLLDPGGGERQRLGATERDLLAAFLANPGRVLSRDELLDLAPARGDEPFDRSIDNRVTRLRRKIEADPSHPEVIKTVRGGGYLYRPDDPSG